MQEDMSGRFPPPYKGHHDFEFDSYFLIYRKNHGYPNFNFIWSWFVICEKNLIFSKVLWTAGHFGNDNFHREALSIRTAD